MMEQFGSGDMWNDLPTSDSNSDEFKNIAEMFDFDLDIDANDPLAETDDLMDLDPSDLLVDMVGVNEYMGLANRDDVSLDPRLINDPILSSCNENRFSAFKSESEFVLGMANSLEEFGFITGVDEFENEVLSEGAKSEICRSKDIGLYTGTSNSPIKILSATNARSLLRRSNLNENAQSKPTGSTSSWAVPPIIDFGHAASPTNWNTFVGHFDDEDTFKQTRHLMDSSEDELSGCDMIETSGDSYWNDCSHRTLVSDLTPECSDVDSKIRYTSHDHTYSHPQPRQMIPDILTPSDTDDSEVDVESLPSDLLGRSWRQQLDENRQQQTGCRTGIRTLMPVNSNFKEPKIPVSYEVSKKTPVSRKTITRCTQKSAKRSKRVEHLTLEQRESRRLKHNEAERTRRDNHRGLVGNVRNVVPEMYIPKGRLSQQNVMKGAASCMRDYKAQHDKVGLDFATTTIFATLENLNSSMTEWKKVISDYDLNKTEPRV